MQSRRFDEETLVTDDIDDLPSQLGNIPMRKECSKFILSLAVKLVKAEEILHFIVDSLPGREAQWTDQNDTIKDSEQMSIKSKFLAGSRLYYLIY